MPRDPKLLEIFVKPKRRNFWGPFNAKQHELALTRAIEFDRTVRENRKNKGMVSLRRRRNKVRFGLLPERDRPAAEAELERLVNRVIQQTGHPPSKQKYYSLMANACFIIRQVRSGNYKRWCNRTVTYRRMLDKLDAKKAREGTPAEAPTPPKRRSSWRGLQGL
jgi:hypothetical protein